MNTVQIRRFPLALTIATLILTLPLGSVAMELTDADDIADLRIKFDTRTEQPTEGEFYFLLISGKKRGLVKITSVEAQGRAIGRLVKGVASEGATMSKAAFTAKRTSTNGSREPAQAAVVIPSSPAPPAHEEAGGVKSFLLISSNVVWRGLSATGNSPAVKGMISLPLWGGFETGVMVGNKIPSIPGEVDFMLSYTVGSPGLSLSVSYWRYEFITLAEQSSDDYGIQLSLGNFSGELSHIPNWFNSESAALYGKLAYTISLTETLRLTPSVGYTAFSQNESVDSSDYVETRIGITRSSPLLDMELLWSNTNRVRISTEKSYLDQTVAVNLSKSF